MIPSGCALIVTVLAGAVHGFVTPGFRPELHFGVDPVSMNADRLMAHCWVCLDGKPVLSDRQPGMATIYVHTLE